MTRWRKLGLVIRCLVYNHENYLSDCLNGIVGQEINYKYPTIVHDDASTASSVSIIREFDDKYPELISPIYQTEH